MTTALTTDYADSMPIYCVIHLLTLATWKLLDGWFALALLQFRSLATLSHAAERERTCGYI